MPDDASVVLGPKLGQVNYANIGANFPNSLRALLRALDALVQAAVLSVTLATPPGSPNDGDAYIVAASPTGAWAGKAGQIAVWSAEIATTDTNTKVPSWEFHAPKAGWFVFNNGDGNFYYYNGTAWAASNAAGIVPVAKGGTGTATPGLVAGGGIAISGAWPDQTVAIASEIDPSNAIEIGEDTDGHFRIAPSGGTIFLEFFQNRSGGSSITVRVTDLAGAHTWILIDTSGNVTFSKNVTMQGTVAATALSVFANNAAAITGGLVAGDFYRTGGNPDQVCVVH